MRVANPDYYLDKFIKSTESSWGNYQFIYDSLPAPRSSDSRAAQKWLCRNTIIELARQWESFLGDWTVAAISRYPARFADKQEGRIRDSLKGLDNLPQVLKEKVSCSVVPGGRFTMSEISGLLDEKERNIEFSSAAQWERFAVQYLDGPPKVAVHRLCGDPESSNFYDYFKSLRNALAHGSKASLSRFNEASSTDALTGKSGALENAGLIRGENQVQDIGRYLNAVVGPDLRRVGLIFGRVEDMAGRLKLS